MSFFSRLFRKRSGSQNQNGSADDQGKKSTSKDNQNTTNTANAVMKMEKKFKKILRSGGVVYNMKVVIRGMRNCGKSTLLQRLQGKPIIRKYIPTPEIQTGHINWSDKKNLDHVVKIEVWDIVDLAMHSDGILSAVDKSLGGAVSQDDVMAGLKRFDEEKIKEWCQRGKGSAKLRPLDATCIDVYTGAHGCIFVFDPTRMWVRLPGKVRRK